MSWAKLDDGFWMHPKVLRAGNEAAGIFARCLSYCGMYLTDGLIPQEVAVMIAGSPRALEKVVDAGLVERLETGSIYIRDYLVHNPSRDEVEAKAAERKSKAERAARARWNNGHASPTT